MTSKSAKTTSHQSHASSSPIQPFTLRSSAFAASQTCLVVSKWPPGSETSCTKRGATLSLCLHVWATRGMNGWQKKEEDAKLSFCGESDSKSIPGKFGQQEAHFPAFSPHVQVPSSLPSPLPVPLFLLPVSQPIEWQNVEATASRQAKTKTRTYCSENSEREKQYKQIH